MEVRDEIADIIFKRVGRGRQLCYEVTDAILDIPAIKAGLEAVKRKPLDTTITKVIDWGEHSGVIVEYPKEAPE